MTVIAGDMRRAAGFTLIELLVTIAVVAILATVAVPNFQGIVERNRVAADYNEILAALHFSRSEAVKQREEVAASIYTDADGWAVDIKVDSDGDGDLSDEAAIRSAYGGDDGVAVTGALIWFNELGRRESCSVSPCRIDVGGEVMEVNVAGNIAKVN
ncbi:GspH/FimT family pseudopilin [Halomonas organivorans]